MEKSKITQGQHRRQGVVVDEEREIKLEELEKRRLRRREMEEPEFARERQRRRDETESEEERQERWRAELEETGGAGERMAGSVSRRKAYTPRAIPPPKKISGLSRSSSHKVRELGRNNRGEMEREGRRISEERRRRDMEEIEKRQREMEEMERMQKMKEEMEKRKMAADVSRREGYAPRAISPPKKTRGPSHQYHLGARDSNNNNRGSVEKKRPSRNKTKSRDGCIIL